MLLILYIFLGMVVTGIFLGPMREKAEWTDAIKMIPVFVLFWPIVAGFIIYKCEEKNDG